MPRPRHRIVVLGFMGNCPIAGVIWQAVHYLVGFQRLGHEVYYVEDTSRPPYDPVALTVTEDTAYVEKILAQLAREFGFEGRWGFSPRYRSPRETLGPLSRDQINELYRSADAVINVCGSHELNEDLELSERLVYVESDPGVEQIKVDQGDEATRRYLNRHAARFTFGENIGRPEFPVPLHGLEWLPTRQPVVLDFWRSAPPARAEAVFTTIANLATGGKKDITWRDSRYLWSKLPEFEKFRLAPAACGEVFEMATHFKGPDLARRFEEAGWRSVSPDAMSVAYGDYARYIQGSKGEFTVAKDQYVRLNTGWFSDRTACYLAAGRPAITQETGFTRLYGGSEGLFAFRSLDDVVYAAAEIRADYARHAQAAADIAQEWFDAEKVCGEMLHRLGL